MAKCLRKWDFLCSVDSHLQNKNGIILANKYKLKVKNGNTRKRCEICSNLIRKTSERRPSRSSSDVFITNFEPISNLLIVFLLLTLNR